MSLRPITLGKSPVLLHAVDGMAARQLRPGFDYQPDKVVLTADQSVPFALSTPAKSAQGNPSYEDLRGRRFGRLVVQGLAADFPGKWACRCDCGTYTLRKARAIQNPRNNKDRCEHCRHLAYLQREDHFRQTGKEREWKP